MYYTTYGTDRFDYLGRPYMSAHPDTRFWFEVGPGPHRLKAEVGMVPAAYAESVPLPDRSDGIEVRIEAQLPDGGVRLLGSRLINPRDHESDRGIRQAHRQRQPSKRGEPR